MRAVILHIGKTKDGNSECLKFLHKRNIDVVSSVSTSPRESEILYALEYAATLGDYVFVLLEKPSFKQFKDIFCKFNLTDLVEGQPRGSKKIKDSTAFIYPSKKTEFIVSLKLEFKMLMETIAIYLESSQKKPYAHFTIKTFGPDEESLLNHLGTSITKNKYKILISATSEGLEGEVVVRYKTDTPRDNIEAIKLQINDRLKNFIYSDLNIAINEYAVELLKIRNKKVNFIENITGGKIAKYFINENNDQLNEALVLNSTQSFEENFGITEQFLLTKTNADIAYELALKLLEYKQDDIVIATYGKETDISIAIGDREQIAVYNTNTENIEQKALFYLIKKLK